MFSIWIGQPHLHTNLPVARWALSFVCLTWQFRRKDCAPMSSYARAYAHSHTYARAIAQTTKRPLEPRGDWRELHPRSRTRWSLRPEKEQTAIRYKVITVHILSQRSQTRRRTHTHTHTHTHCQKRKKRTWGRTPRCAMAGGAPHSPPLSTRSVLKHAIVGGSAAIEKDKERKRPIRNQSKSAFV